MKVSLAHAQVGRTNCHVIQMGQRKVLHPFVRTINGDLIAVQDSFEGITEKKNLRPYEKEVLDENELTDAEVVWCECVFIPTDKVKHT